MKKVLSAMLALTVGIAAVSAFAACSPKGVEEEAFTVYAPDGAPALALANAVHEGNGDFEYHIVASETITAQVTGEAPAADFCVLPVNAAAKLLGTGESYQMLGTVTNGNMYFLTTGDNAPITKDNISSLVGKKVGVVQLNNVPGLTLQAVLAGSDLDVNIVGNDGTTSAAAVNLQAFDAGNVSPTAGCDYYLCPEPAATAKIKATASAKAPFKSAGSLQELYGENGYPQAVLVAKTAVISEHKAVVDTLIGYMQGSAEYLASASAQEVVDVLAPCYTQGMTPTLNANSLNETVIANCSVRFTAAKDCKERVNTFLAQLIGVSAQFTSAVSDAFYYAG